MPLWIVEDEEGCSFLVRVAPRGRRDEIIGLHGDALKVRLTAPPVEGRANRALVKFLARQLGVPSGAVEIRSGHTGRQKRVWVRGVTAEEVRALAAVPPSA